MTDDASAPAEVAEPPAAPVPNARSPARYLWAMLRARLFESLPLVCRDCGADRRLIAFITHAVPIERILEHIGEPPRPPPIAPALRNPAPLGYQPKPSLVWASAASSQLTLPPGMMLPNRRRTGTLSPNRTPGFELDQRLSW